MCGRLAERSRAGRGAGGLGGAAPRGATAPAPRGATAPAPRGATAPAPEGVGIGPVAVVGVARVAGTGGVRTPRSGILAGWSGRRGGVAKGPSASQRRRIKSRGLAVPGAQGRGVHGLTEEVGGLIPGGVGEEAGTDEGGREENIIYRERAEGPQ